MITVGTLEAWLWATVYGGNGRQITPFMHLFRGQRGRPPEADPNREPWRYNRRIYWNPWMYPFNNDNPPNALQPMCGRLKSVSRFPRLNPRTDQTWGRRLPQCPNCLQLATNVGITPAFYNILATNDPWAKLTAEEREQPDPVTGL